MAAITYSCPECGATLKPKAPVPAGRKIKCPKCETAFTPVPAGEKPAPAKAAAKGQAAAKVEPAAPAKPAGKSLFADADKDDFHDSTPYDVIKDQGAEGEKVTFDKIRDRYPKSKRGPAQALVVKPSNFLLSFGITQCVVSLGFIVRWIFPLVFWDTAPPRERVIQCFTWMGLYAIAFIWGAFICHGASKMHSLESYGWAMTGTIMAIIGSGPICGWGAYLAWWASEEPTVAVAGGLPGLATHLGSGIWCLKQLLKQPVKDGFAEGVPDYIREMN
jgi:hypothetical protein